MKFDCSKSLCFFPFMTCNWGGRGGGAVRTEDEEGLNKSKETLQTPMLFFLALLTRIVLGEKKGGGGSGGYK